MTANLPNESHRPGISQITEAVFSTMLQLPIGAIEPAQQEEHYELTAAVYYAGAWQGALLLECSMEQAMNWGSRLMDLPSPIAVEDARDSIAELCNVLAGNLKPLLPPGVGLSTPSVVKGADYSLRVRGDTLCERLHFADPAGDFRVTLIIS
jgi:CheY-specific phosphatase CheX